MSGRVPISWRARRWFWARWQVFRHGLSKPQTIGPPGRNKRPIEAVPMRQVHPQIPLEKVLMADHLPGEENKLGMRLLVRTGLLLARIVPQMRRGLPEVDGDGDTALDDALISIYAGAFKRPERPSTYEGAGPTDIGELAVMSPYAVFTERDPDGNHQWDFRPLGEFEHHEGLCSLGLRVFFSPTPGVDGRNRLAAVRIESDHFGRVEPGDDLWERSTALAICAATTHLALTRHFNYVHLISGDHWDVATRNRLPTDHPLYRLVWPHIFNSLYTNHGVTRVQMLPDGDFVNVFSFTHTGLMEYFDAMYERYDIAVTDPAADWTRRGLVEGEFDCPTHANLVELFDVMHAHATRYIDAYYDSDEQLAADPEVRAWLDELDTLVPNGVSHVLGDSLTRAGLARLIGGYIFEGNTMHDIAGTTLWDYQLWADRNPVRVYADGSRVPLDVLQRAINNNFALQLVRAPMLHDYGKVALDDRGAALFTRFYEDCAALQRRYDTTPAGPWRMEPKNLEINMNG